MRIKSLIAALTLAGCTTTPAPMPAPSAGGPHGFTLEEEAMILRLEDRREFDRTVSRQWMTHTNALHRARMALALGRIGPHTFDDQNGNRLLDANERMGGVDLLVAAAEDREYEVRRNVAFALGEIGDAAGIGALVRLAKDGEHADVAAEAVEALSKMAARVPFASYREAISDTREGVRTRAIRFLFRFGTDEAMGVAHQLLDAANPLDRREAAYAISRKAYAPARQRLELLLTDGDVLTRAYAARALGLIGNSASIDALIAAFGDTHPWVRTNAARAIVQIADKNSDAMRRRPAEDVVRVMALTEDADPGTRVTAVDTLAVYAPFNDAALKRLTEIAVSGAPFMREAAAGAIAKQIGTGGRSPLAALLQTDAPWVKVRAIEGSAAKSWGSDVRRQLASDPAPNVRANVASAIGDEPSATDLELLRMLMSDADPVVRSAAIDKFAALKSIPSDEKVAALRDAEKRGVADTMNDARLSAISALAKIDFPEREEFLRERISDPDPVVRRTAADAIAAELKLPRPQYTPLTTRFTDDDYRTIAEWSRTHHTATIKMRRGDIELVLFPQDAPMTAWNFATLARSGYFNGTSFMRVVPNFVIQGGDPRNDMSGGPGYAIRDEINLQKYTRGAVGMALSGPDTGGSQFFITHSPQHHLDGGYTIFARVANGMDAVVDRTERGDQVLTITID